MSSGKTLANRTLFQSQMRVSYPYMRKQLQNTGLFVMLKNIWKIPKLRKRWWVLLVIDVLIVALAYARPDLIIAP